MRGAFLDWDSLNGDELDRDSLHALPVDWQYFANIGRSELEDGIDDYDILISNKVNLDTALLSKAKRLKLICIAATGTNNVDLTSATDNQVIVTNVRAYATESVVQHVFMLILNLMRHFPDYQQSLANGAWQNSEHFCLLNHPVQSLTGKTLGIIGYGELGQAVARMGQCFGMKILVAESMDNKSQQTGRVCLTELYAQADVISLHCPLTPETENLINRDVFTNMQNTAFLINTARGGIVNEQDLLTALQSGQIAGAALDVLQQEPPKADDFLLKASLPNLIITPHIAWASLQARQSLLDKVAQNIQAWISGNVINQVN